MLLIFLLLLLPLTSLSQTWSDIDTATYRVVSSGVIGTDVSLTPGIDSYVIEFTKDSTRIRWELDLVTEEDGIKLYMDAGGEYYYVEDKLQFVMVGKRVRNGSVRKYVIEK